MEPRETENYSHGKEHHLSHKIAGFKMGTGFYQPHILLKDNIQNI